MTMTEQYCNERFLDECLRFLETAAIDHHVIIIDYGWFVMNGQWRPHTGRFAQLPSTR